MKIKKKNKKTSRQFFAPKFHSQAPAENIRQSAVIFRTLRAKNFVLGTTNGTLNVFDID